jgi:hypothetical protein
MDYTSNIDAQGMRRPMGPVDQPNWNGGPRLNHNPQVMNNQAVGQPNLANAMARVAQLTVIFREDLIPSQFLISLVALTMEFVMASML